MPRSRHRKINRAKKRPRGMASAPGGPGPRTQNERRMKTLAIIVIGILVLSVAGYFLFFRGGGQNPEVTLKDGLKYTDVVVGTGPIPQRGQSVSVLYTGKLQNGKVFDSSEKHGGAPYVFALGMHEVIPGWDEGIATMKVGGKRKLVIPPKLGYGQTGSGDIPPNSVLLFDVELVSAK